MNGYIKLIEQIDEEIILHTPPGDDYDAGMIEGLRRARAMIEVANRNTTWDDIFGGEEFAEFRYTGTED